MTINEKIVDIAEDFEGLVETLSNAEWDNLRTKGRDESAGTFEQMIKRAGHQDGWPYCMSFCEGVWVTAYEQSDACPNLISRIRRLLSPSVMNSYTDCAEAGLISREPQRGAIMFMQAANTWRGHAGIVSDVDGLWFRTIEANTSTSDANERDGKVGTGGVWRKRRQLALVPKTSGLWLRGFLNPISI